MSSLAEQEEFARINRAPNIVVVKPPPPLPEEVLKRFPAMRDWQNQFKKYLVEDLGLVIKGGV